MKIIGLYGATGSSDFGDYAMMVHNVQDILELSDDVEISIFTPDKNMTLQNLNDNLLNQYLMNRIKVVEEPKIRRKFIEKAIDYICNKLINKKPFFESKYKKTISGKLDYLNCEFLNSIKKLDVMLFNGGGYLQHSWRYSNNIFALQMVVAGYLGKPVYMLGNSIGPMKKWKYCIADALPYINEIMIRDGKNYTAKLLDELNYRNFFCGPDDLFFVNDCYDSVPMYENYVVIELMSWIDKAAHGGKYVVNRLAELLDHILQEGRNVVLTIFDNADNKAIEYIDYLKKKSSCPEKVFAYTEIKSMYEIFSIYKHCMFSISFKYHPLILALGSNKPCIGVICDNDGYYEGKLKGACDNADVVPEKHIIHIDDIDDTKLINMYDELKEMADIVDSKNHKKLYDIRKRYLRRIVLNEE